MYQYEYFITTGLSKCIYTNGKAVAIQFHKNSDKKKLGLLNALSPSILYPSSKRIHLIGKLHKEIKLTPSGENYPTQEEYQEFELVHWYILCPFEENIGDEFEIQLIERNKLVKGDIGLGTIGMLFINIEEYYKNE